MKVLQRLADLQNSRMAGLWSIKLTSAPNTAINDAYSRPTTPAPTTMDFFRKTTRGVEVIGVHNATVVKRNLRAVRRSCATSDQDLFSFNTSPSALNFDCVRIGEQRIAVIDRNPVSRQLRSDYFSLSFDNRAHTGGDILDGNATVSESISVQGLYG